MNKLGTLRNRLARLRRRRRWLRLTTGYSGLGLALLTILGGALAMDWFLEMSRSQRIVALVVALGGLVWAVRRYTLPWLGQREDEVDMALLVERREKIDSDLVAALEFESPGASAWGSEQLEQAVIQQAVRIGEGLDISRGLSLRPLVRRVAALAIVVAVWAGIACCAPEVINTFFQRLMLSARRYPSRTLIESITVNGQPIDPHDPGRAPIKLAYGAPVRFAMVCSGRLPPGGQALLTVVPHGPQAIVALATERRTAGTYHGELPRLLESVEFRLLAGDAATEPGQLLVVSPPVADLEMEVVPPSYTGGHGPVRVASGLRQVPVIEGSQVNLRIRCDKPLRHATLAIDQRQFSLRREAASGPRAESWALDAPNTPLAAVVEDIQYSIQVNDLDGLKLQQPLQGTIRIQPDQPPRISGGIVTPKVLPTARPTVHFEASDDYGIARVAIVRQVIHADGQTSEDRVEIYKQASEEAIQRKLENSYSLDLTPLKLVKGDQVKIVLEAVDYRGPRPGQATSSDPMVFQVTDQQGILTMMMESDRQSAEQLKKMIHEQLGIGGAP